MSTLEPASVAEGYSDLSIVVPALNEGAHVREVLESLVMAFPGAEVLLVDNGSEDETFSQALEVAARRRGVRVLSTHRRGKGHAMQAGAHAASRPLLMFQDADLEYRVEDAKALVAAVRSTPLSMAVGVRTTSFGQPPWSSLLANALIRRLLAWRFGPHALQGADILCGTRVLPRDAFLSMGVTAADFRVETQLTRKALQHRLTLVHLPVAYAPRSRAQGKKIRPRHLWGLMREALLARG